MMAPLPSWARRRCRSHIAALAFAAIGVASFARAEDARPRVIETPALKLFGDGFAPSPPPAPNVLPITTPPLRLIGDGSAPSRRAPPTSAITIETRPLRLIGAKP